MTTKTQKSVTKQHKQLLLCVLALADPQDANAPFTLYRDDGERMTLTDLQEKTVQELWELTNELFTNAEEQRMMW